jgi:hypothetical protein
LVSGSRRYCHSSNSDHSKLVEMFLGQTETILNWLRGFLVKQTILNWFRGLLVK